MHEQDALAAELVAELADRLEERQALDVADRAADLAEHEILAVEIGQDEFLDGVGDVRDDLHGRAEIFAAPLAADHRRIDPAGGDRIAAPRGDADIALVMAEIEIGLGAVVGDEDLAVLVGAHRAGIDVEVGIELAQPDLEPARLQQRAERRRRETLAERGDHAAGDEDEPRHGTSVYSIEGLRHILACGPRGRRGSARRAVRSAEPAPPAAGGGLLALPELAGAAGAPCSMIERGARSRLCKTTSRMLVVMNVAARIAVARVSRFAVERPVINPDMPPPPMPSAPPSLFCKRTTPTSEIATRM